MTLTDEQHKRIRSELEGSLKPMFFFHDDPDGLASFLLLYRFVKRGKCVVVKKSTPSVGEDFLRKVQEYCPDKIFVLDVAIVEQGFIDKAQAQVIWIDHHEVLKRERVLYFNPRTGSPADNEPVTSLCYKAVRQDEWIAAVGIIGDWFVPEFLPDLRKKYPGLAGEKESSPQDLLFSTRLGLLSKIFSFNLKGKNEDVLKCVKVLTRIESPLEILDRSTSRGRLIFNRYSYINKKYEKLLETAKKAKKGNAIVYIYKNDMSFTGDLSNELLYLYHDALIVVGRERQDAIKLSIRNGKLPVRDALKEALKDVNGHGGGHEYACGAVVKKNDFDAFIESLKKNFGM